MKESLATSNVPIIVELDWSESMINPDDRQVSMINNDTYLIIISLRTLFPRLEGSADFAIGKHRSSQPSWSIQRHIYAEYVSHGLYLEAINSPAAYHSLLDMGAYLQLAP